MATRDELAIRERVRVRQDDRAHPFSFNIYRNRIFPLDSVKLL